MGVAAAGNRDHAKVVRAVRTAFATAGLLDRDETPQSVRSATGARPAVAVALTVTRRPTEQANLVLGTAGISRRDERRFAFGVLNNTCLLYTSPSPRD